MLIASRDDYLLWAKSNEAAFRSRAFFATRKRTLELPTAALAHSLNCTGRPQSHTTHAQIWFPREPATMPITEMTKVAANYDYTLTLLQMPDAEWRAPDHGDEVRWRIPMSGSSTAGSCPTEHYPPSPAARAPA